MIGREVEETNLKNYNYYLQTKIVFSIPCTLKTRVPKQMGPGTTKLKNKSAFDS